MQAGSVFDASELDAVSDLLGAAMMDTLQNGLRAVHLDVVPEDSIGVIALRVVDSRSVGTAYLEFRDGELQVRVVLHNDGKPDIA
jgi:hypothetical protein